MSSLAKKASLVLVFVTIVLDMLALGIVIPVLPKLIEDFLNGDAVKTAQMLGLFGTVWALMQFFFSPIMGILSDRFGRRPVILISNFGLVFDYILMFLAPNLSWLLIGRVISGITSASIPAATSYIADVTPPEKRSAAFGMVGMAFGVGFILGPALGGFFGDFNPRYPFLLAGTLSLLNGLYAFFVLPESLAKEFRTPFSWRRANPVASVGLLLESRLVGFAAINFILSLSHAIFPSIMVLYMSYRYGWTVKQVGFMMAAVGLTNGIVQGALIAPAVRRLGDRGSLILGLIFGTIGFGLAGIADTSFWFWWSVPFLALWGLANAVIQGMMSQRVGPKEQGELQGAIGSLRGITELIGPFIFTLSFAYFIDKNHSLYFPGAPFAINVALMLAALGFAVLGRGTRVDVDDGNASISSVVAK